MARDTNMTDKVLEQSLREHLPVILEEALRSQLPELLPEALSSIDVERRLHRALEAAKKLAEEIDDLATRSYDIEHSLKHASSWASYLEDDLENVRRR